MDIRTSTAFHSQSSVNTHFWRYIMRGSLVSALALLLSSCAVISESGTEEKLSFAGADEARQHAVLKPHDGMPLSIEFSCPTKIFSAMTSFYIPLPPVVPVGFVNKHVSYLRVRLPQDAEYVVPQIRITTYMGQPVALPQTPKSRRDANGATELTYALNSDCEALDNGTLEIAGFSYKKRTYPASAARLQFDSRIKTVVSYGLA